RRGRARAAAHAERAPGSVVLLARVLLAGAARRHRRRAAGAARGDRVGRAGPRELGLGIPVSGQPRLQPRGLRRGRSGVPAERAEEALYVANGVNVDVELALFDADHGGGAATALAHARAAAAASRSVVVEDALGWTLFRAGYPHRALRAADRALRLGTRDATF